LGQAVSSVHQSTNDGSMNAQELASLKEQCQTLQAKVRELQGALYIEKQSNETLQTIIEDLRKDV